MKKVIIILSALAVTASGYGQTNNNQNNTMMKNIEFIPQEFNDVKLGYYETIKNPCSPGYPQNASDFLWNAIAINVPEKIICYVNDSTFLPVIPVCIAYVIGEKRGLKYAHLSTPVIHARKIDEEIGYSGEMIKPNSFTPALPPNYRKDEKERQQRIKKAQKYSEEEIDKKEGQGSGGFKNENLMDYVKMSFVQGIYEIYLSFCGLESNRVKVEIIFKDENK